MNGRRRVLCCGTFDLLHPGHESYLAQAAGLGEELIVVVARDENVKRLKGRRPSQGENVRRAAVEKLEVVTEARLGNSGEHFLRVVDEIDPDVIALGYDQGAPAGLAEAFPRCQIVTMEPHCPEKYKSSYFRKKVDER